MQLKQNDQIKKAADYISNGGVVIFPTETVYGIGANALDKNACAKIFEIKKRPFFDPLICHVSSYEMFNRIARDTDERLLLLCRKLWPGPLTIVCKKQPWVPDIVTSGLHTVAVRMPANDIAFSIIEAAGVPIAAPSANLFGCLSPTEYSHVKHFENAVDMIIDGGSCSVGIESTIVSVVGGIVHILRPGIISKTQIEEIIGEEVLLPEENNHLETPEVPGQLKSHYAPDAKVVLIDEGQNVPDADKACLLAFRENNRSNIFLSVEILSHTGDMLESAANLFSAMHRLDDHRPEIIFAERVNETGIGAAIMNRLKKAAGGEDESL